MARMNRRTFLQAAAVAALSLSLKAEQPLTVASFNILFQDPKFAGKYTWVNRRERLMKWLLQQRYDFLALQEVLPPQRADLERGLGGVYGFVGRPVNADGTGATNLILYRRDFKLQHADTFWLSDEPALPGSQTLKGQHPDEPRTCTVARFDNGLTLMATHFDPHEVKTRTLSADVLREHLPPTGPVVLLGDLNADEDEPALKGLLTNAYRQAHPEGLAAPTYHAFGGTLPFPPRHIDYILTRGLTVLSCDVIRPEGDFLSDHYPLVAKLTVNRAP